MTITLANLHEASEQQVFDQVATHLLTQRNVCEAWDEARGRKICSYRNPEGLKCAAGCLISNEEYSSSFEGSEWDRLFRVGAVPEDHFDLIVNLQNIHDNYSVDTWEQELKQIARNYELKWTR